MDSKHTMEERGDNYTLTVANVRQQDLGEYTCSAVNKIGEAQATVLLTGRVLVMFKLILTILGQFQ